jgi:hypothetical protein
MRLMDNDMIARHLENLDRRLANVEHILLQDIEPRLAGVEQILRQDIEPRLARVEQILLQEIGPRLARVEKTLPTLANKGDLRAEHERSRLDMRMLLEHQDSKLELLAEHVLSLTSKRTEE